MPSRILIIDDAPANIQTLSSILKERGYNINIATNGRQGLEVLERIRPDLILLDIMMPEMDGFETCQRIKASTAWREIPIVFLTAKTDTADIVRAFELGAVDYVPKPFNAHELLARVNTHLTLDHLHRENERLLLNVLPASIANKLKQQVGIIAERFYDVWGDTVNTASRLESHAAPGRTQVSETVFERLQGRFAFEARGTIELKGRGPMNTYFLDALTP